LHTQSLEGVRPAVSRLDDLQKLRLDLLDWMLDAPVDRKAALVAQYRATLAEIDELEPKESTGDGIDEIAARRSARRPGPAKRQSRTKQPG
jgi:hypothetical protein